jgi:hypothetical protein
LAALAIQHVVRSPLHLLISVVSFLTMAVIWDDYGDDIITEVLNEVDSNEGWTTIYSKSKKSKRGKSNVQSMEDQRTFASGSI